MRLRISTQELIWGMRIEYYDDWGLGFGSELGEWIILFEIRIGIWRLDFFKWRFGFEIANLGQAFGLRWLGMGIGIQIENYI